MQNTLSHLVWTLITHQRNASATEALPEGVSNGKQFFYLSRGQRYCTSVAGGRWFVGNVWLYRCCSSKRSINQQPGWLKIQQYLKGFQVHNAVNIQVQLLLILKQKQKCAWSCFGLKIGRAFLINSRLYRSKDGPEVWLNANQLCMDMSLLRLIPASGMGFVYCEI